MTAAARFEEIANLVLDGVASPAERAELDATIARDPAAREQWETLQATFAELAKLTAPEPPADLKPAILRAIRAESTPAIARAERRPLWDFFRWGTAFVAGAAAGILIWSQIAGRDTRDIPSSATMMPPAAGTTLARTALEAGRAKVEIESRDVNGDLELRLRGRAAADAQLVIEHGAGMKPVSIDGNSGSTHRVAMAGDRTAVAFANALDCAIRFHADGSEKPTMYVTLESESRSAEGVIQGKH